MATTPTTPTPALQEADANIPDNLSTSSPPPPPDERHSDAHDAHKNDLPEFSTSALVDYPALILGRDNHPTLQDRLPLDRHAVQAMVLPNPSPVTVCHTGGRPWEGDAPSLQLPPRVVEDPPMSPPRPQAPATQPGAPDAPAEPLAMPRPNGPPSWPALVWLGEAPVNPAACLPDAPPLELHTRQNPTPKAAFPPEGFQVTVVDDTETNCPAIRITSSGAAPFNVPVTLVPFSTRPPSAAAGEGHTIIREAGTLPLHALKDFADKATSAGETVTRKHRTDIWTHMEPSTTDSHLDLVVASSKTSATVACGVSMETAEAVKRDCEESDPLLFRQRVARTEIGFKDVAHTDHRRAVMGFRIPLYGGSGVKDFDVGGRRQEEFGRSWEMDGLEIRRNQSAVVNLPFQHSGLTGTLSLVPSHDEERTAVHDKGQGVTKRNTVRTHGAARFEAAVPDAAVENVFNGVRAKHVRVYETVTIDGSFSAPVLDCQTECDDMDVGALECVSFPDPAPEQKATPLAGAEVDFKATGRVDEKTCSYVAPDGKPFATTTTTDNDGASWTLAVMRVDDTHRTTHSAKRVATSGQRVITSAVTERKEWKDGNAHHVHADDFVQQKTVTTESGVAPRLHLAPTDTVVDRGALVLRRRRHASRRTKKIDAGTVTTDTEHKHPRSGSWVPDGVRRFFGFKPPGSHAGSLAVTFDTEVEDSHTVDNRPMDEALGACKSNERTRTGTYTFTGGEEPASAPATFNGKPVHPTSTARTRFTASGVARQVVAAGAVGFGKAAADVRGCVRIEPAAMGREELEATLELPRDECYAADAGEVETTAHLWADEKTCSYVAPDGKPFATTTRRAEHGSLETLKAVRVDDTHRTEHSANEAKPTVEAQRVVTFEVAGGKEWEEGGKVRNYQRFAREQQTEKVQSGVLPEPRLVPAGGNVPTTVIEEVVRDAATETLGGEEALILARNYDGKEGDLTLVPMARMEVTTRSKTKGEEQAHTTEMVAGTFKHVHEVKAVGKRFPPDVATTAEATSSRTLTGWFRTLVRDSKGGKDHAVGDEGHTEYDKKHQVDATAETYEAAADAVLVANDVPCDDPNTRTTFFVIRLSSLEEDHDTEVTANTASGAEKCFHKRRIESAVGIQRTESKIRESSPPRLFGLYKTEVETSTVEDTSVTKITEMYDSIQLEPVETGGEAVAQWTLQRTKTSGLVYTAVSVKHDDQRRDGEARELTVHEYELSAGASRGLDAITKDLSLRLWSSATRYTWRLAEFWFLCKLGLSELSLGTAARVVCHKAPATPLGGLLAAALMGAAAAGGTHITRDGAAAPKLVAVAAKEGIQTVNTLFTNAGRSSWFPVAHVVVDTVSSAYDVWLSPIGLHSSVVFDFIRSLAGIAGATAVEALTAKVVRNFDRTDAPRLLKRSLLHAVLGSTAISVARTFMSCLATWCVDRAELKCCEWRLCQAPGRKDVEGRVKELRQKLRKSE